MAVLSGSHKAENHLYFCRKKLQTGCNLCVRQIRASARSSAQKLILRHAQGRCAKRAENHTLRFGGALKKLAHALYSERNVFP